jgi:hypothetical protein
VSAFHCRECNREFESPSPVHFHECRPKRRRTVVQLEPAMATRSDFLGPIHAALTDALGLDALLRRIE